jgi:hypothetical protein
MKKGQQAELSLVKSKLTDLKKVRSSEGSDNGKKK